MKIKTILEIRKLLQDKAKSSEEEYMNERNRLEKKYNTDWIMSHCNEEERKKMNELKNKRYEWKNILDEFENNEL